MSAPLFRVEVKATGVVRDAGGNVLSQAPVEGTFDLTADQLIELGLPVPPHPDEEK